MSSASAGHRFSWARPLLLAKWAFAVALVAVPLFFSGWVAWWSSLLMPLPVVLIAIAAVGLTLWVLFAAVPGLTLSVASFLDERLPGVVKPDRVGTVLRYVVVGLGPVAAYVLLMGTRNWQSALSLGLLHGFLWLLTIRSIWLAAVNLDTYSEDQLRKHLFRGGEFDKAKFAEALAQVEGETNPDIKRTRLRRLVKLYKAVENRDIDPNLVREAEILSVAQIATADLELDLKDKLDELGRTGLVDEKLRAKLEAKIAGWQRKKRDADAEDVAKQPRRPMTAEEKVRKRVAQQLEMTTAIDEVIDTDIKGLDKNDPNYRRQRSQREALRQKLREEMNG